MPTSEPWNPSNPHICDSYFDCALCDRQDRKIRCTIGTPAGPLAILFWDEQQIDNFMSHVRNDSANFYPLRTWDYNLYLVRPCDVCYFHQNDKDPIEP